jgi:outer membrane lipopolysaccharide assembly protein LptE/RlpB
MEKMKKVTQFVLVALVLVLTGCGSKKVTLEVPRPPTLNTSDVKRLAVMPFEAARPQYQGIAQHATNVATSKIQATNNFTLVSYAMVEPRRRANQSFDDLVDAIFTGQITHIEEESGCKQSQYTDKKGNTYVSVSCSRVVQVQFNYSIIKARDGSIIGPVNKTGNASASSSSADGLPSIEALARSAIDIQMALMYRDIVPHTVQVTRSLAKESDKILQPQMEAALAQVEAGNYKAARDAYISIYESSKSMAAAENASIFLEALGETQAAADLMQRVVNETGNPVATQILARLNAELQATAAVSAFKETKDQKEKDTRSAAEKVAEVASSEVQKYLPDSARVWIINNSAAENVLINNVIDNMTATLLRDGIIIVDRQSTALVQAEQKFQMSGHVSDEDIVGIGNIAGVNRVIMLSVVGSGPSRRLQVRVLDVQRSVLLMQSDTDEKWSL